MVPAPVNFAPGIPKSLTRRELLRDAAAVVAGLAAGSMARAHPFPNPADPPPQADASPASATTPIEADGQRPWWWAAEPGRARVVECRDPGIAATGEFEVTRVRELLELGLRIYADTADTPAAWRALLGDARRLTLKFNRVGAEVLGTNEVVAAALVGSLEAAGFERGDITAVELPRPTLRSLGVEAAPGGWSGSVVLEGEDEPLAAYLAECDAIINIPLLKTHRLAGMSGAMKNISHAVVRRPARYHANACAPYVGQVIGTPAVERKLRLTITNCLRIVCAHGPEATVDNSVSFEGFHIGRDPVAMDAVGESVLRAERARLSDPKPLTVDYLEAAAASKVGRRALHQIERLRVSPHPA